jgi:hypothetical protein
LEYGLMPLAGVERPFLAISEAEFNAIRDVKASLLYGLAVKEAFDFVVEDYKEFEGSLLEVALTHLVRSDFDDQRFNEDRSLFNRRLMNWLTAVKSYVEQMPKQVAAISPKAGPRAGAAVEEARSSSFGLQAMLALRNYIQHHDSVVNRVTYGSRLAGKTPDGLQAFAVDPFISAEDLQLDDGMHKRDRAVLEELRALGPQVDLKPLVRQCLEALWLVHSKVRDEISPLSGPLEQVLAGAKVRYHVAHPDVPLGSGLAAVAREEGRDPSAEVHVVWAFADYRRHLESKNNALVGVARRYVTSESREKP